MVSANQLYRNSGTTLSFKDWLDREKNKGKFIPNVEAIKEFNSFDGTNPTEDAKDFGTTLKTNMTKKILALAVVGLAVYIVYKQVSK